MSIPSTAKLWLEILLLMVLYNHSATFIASKYDSLNSKTFSNSSGISQTWSSFFLTMTLQKSGLLVLTYFAWSVLKLIPKPKTHKPKLQDISGQQNQDHESQQFTLKHPNKYQRLQQTTLQTDPNNSLDSQEITFQDSAILGILLFLSILCFTHLISNTNIIYVFIQKALSCFILYFIADQSTDTFFSVSKIFSLFCFVAIIALSILIKTVFNQIQGFFSAQLGALLQEISFSTILFLILMTFLDVTLYSQIFKVINHIKSFTSSGISTFAEILSNLSQTLQLLLAITKYCAVLLFGYSLIKGELFSGLQTIKENPSICILFLQLSLGHFINQSVLIYALTRFGMKVFLILILTNDVFTKAVFFFARTFDIHTVVFAILILVGGLTIRQQINELKEDKSKGP